MIAQIRRPVHSSSRIGVAWAGMTPRLTPVRCRSTVETYTASLLAAEQEGDIMRCMEVVTEARVLKLDLPGHAVEAGIRTFAAGGQWQRAVDMMEALAAQGQHAEHHTAEAVFKALADGQQAERALQLLESLEQSGRSVSSPVRNLVVRTCASAGRLEQALQLLEAMSDNAMRSAMSDDEGSADEIEALTFSTVASECIKAGWSSKAEEVLDMRDYL